ncbi:MAG: DUF4153 domain-containing protein [Mariprofundaceae bacterium]|nr:DUF4153 domain-containing protein [Mariprofundaceae bacterium]
MHKTTTHLITGFIQGCLLLLLHEGIVNQWVLFSSPEFTFAAYALVISIPILLLLCWDISTKKTMAYVIVAATVLLVLLGSYSGSLAFDDIQNNNSATQIFVFGSCMWVLLYISLPFIQSYLRRGHARFSYDDLYEFGWLNTAVMIVAVLFSGLVWLLLGLCAALFSMLDIHVFKDIFSDPYFIYPATAVMFCYGLSLGLQRFNIGMIQRIDFFFRAITVMTSFIVVLFLIALLVSGLEPLWNTRAATFLLLWLQVFIVLFTNSMVQRGYHERSEAALVRWSITLPLIAMPFFSAITIYAISLRIMQYGWTMDRVWAVLIIAVMSLYALGYAYAALTGLFNSKNWLSKVAPSNTYAAMLIITIIILSHSPLLSPAHIAAQSQVNRLTSGEVKADDFDFMYLRFDLGRVGLDQLQTLSEIKDHPEAKRIQKLAKEAQLKKSRWGRNDKQDIQESDIAQLFEVYPKTQSLDAKLAHMLYNKREKWAFMSCFKANSSCFILYADLNRDQQDEAILFTFNHTAQVFTQSDNGWYHAGRLNVKHGHKSTALIQQALKDQDFIVEQNTWDQLKVGEHIWHFQR